MACFAFLCEHRREIIFDGNTKRLVAALFQKKRIKPEEKMETQTSELLYSCADVQSSSK